MLHILSSALLLITLAPGVAPAGVSPCDAARARHQPTLQASLDQPAVIRLLAPSELRIIRSMTMHDAPDADAFAAAMAAGCNRSFGAPAAALGQVFLSGLAVASACGATPDALNAAVQTLRATPCPVAALARSTRALDPEILNTPLPVIQQLLWTLTQQLRAPQLWLDLIHPPWPNSLRRGGDARR
jgi:biotin operon repressor